MSKFTILPPAVHRVVHCPPTHNPRPSPLHLPPHHCVVMRKEREVYSMSCIGVLPFIEGSLGDSTSGLVAVSHNSEEHA